MAARALPLDSTSQSHDRSSSGPREPEISFKNEEEFLDFAMERLDAMSEEEYKAASEGLEKIAIAARASC